MGLTIDLSAGVGLRDYGYDELGTPDGRLSFKSKLGQGAEGSVYLAVPSVRSRGSSNNPKRCRISGIQDKIQRQNGDRWHPLSNRAVRGIQGLPVAVKIVTAHAFRRYCETQCLWPLLRHPNIVFPRKSIFDHKNQRCFLEMEYCEIDLLDMIGRDRPLSEAHAALFAGHLASALAHCHSLGIAHQDVKLENIFMRDGVAKLGDLGSIRQIAPTIPLAHDESPPIQECLGKSRHNSDGPAPQSSPQTVFSSSDRKQLADITTGATRHALSKSSASALASATKAASPSPFPGSPIYAPPEAYQTHGTTATGRQSRAAVEPRDAFAGDIWCLGVVLYCAVAGHLPWERACYRRSPEFRRFVDGGAEGFFPRIFSPAFKSLLSKMLSIDQAKRPTAVEILRNDPWVTTAPVTPPSRPSEPSGRLTGRKCAWPTTTTTTAAATATPPTTPPTPIGQPAACVSPEDATSAAGNDDRVVAGCVAAGNPSPIPLFADIPSTTISMPLHKPIAALCAAVAAVGSVDKAKKRARLSLNGGQTIGTTDASGLACADNGEHNDDEADSRRAATRGAVGAGETLDFGNVSADSDSTINTCRGNNAPSQSFPMSPTLRLPQLESQYIVGRKAPVCDDGGDAAFAALASAVRSGEARNREDVARVTPSPSPQAALPDWTLTSADPLHRREDCSCPLPKFVTVNPLRKAGVKRPVPTGQYDYRTGGGVGFKVWGVSPSKSAFKRCHPAGLGACGAGGAARMSFRLSNAGCGMHSGQHV